ncbi:MAG: GNAT family N-acetyltransferase, partial [Gammaproteobacteria bacterium]|nr:GNAT family N-acetyltransferase [Gammaproteobacteria bacterium]
MPQFQQWSSFITYWQQSQAQQARGLIILTEGEATYSQTIPAILGSSKVQGVSVNLPALSVPGLTNIKPQQSHQYLGRSHNLLVYRAVDEFNINSFCALCGTLVASGIAVIILPEHQPWEQCLDAQAAGYGYTREQVKSPFRVWWQRLWQTHKGVMQLTRAAECEAAPQTSINLPAVPAFKVTDELILNAGQQRVVAAVQALMAQDNAVLWLRGPRGRGKTVALAAAIADLAGQGVQTLITSAASQSASAVLQQHGEYSRYMAIDALLQLPQAALAVPHLVLVEEAASMPMALLQALLKRFSRLVLISTQDGYEGTGQGLATKLPAMVQRHGYILTQVHLKTPMRWRADDPLEDLLSNSFLAPELLPVTCPVDTQDLIYVQLTGVDLIARPQVMQQVYSLLTLAHYQTTPQDLRLLLDHPDLHVHCWLNQQQQLFGVACVMAEGGLSQTLATAIANGERRLTGHLLAQILAQQAGIAEAAGLQMQRIQRIAVHPQVQQQGVGATILRQLCLHYGKHKQTDWLGASFAAEPHVVRFWLASGYQPVWAGQRLDTATALPSLQVVLPISPA